MKKKIVALVLTAFILLVIGGCSDENNIDEMNKLNAKIDELNEIINKQNEKMSELNEMIDTFNVKVDTIEENNNINVDFADNNNQEENFDYPDNYDETLDIYEETSDYITINGEQYNTGLKRLVLDHKITDDDIAQLKYMINLEHLTIGSFDMIISNYKDISPLAELSNLTSLHLGYSTQLSNISPLAGLTNLTELSIASWEIRDISPLAELANLTKLHIRSSSVRDISPLVELMNLNTLTLGSQVTIRNLNLLKELTNLTSLHLRVSKQFSDISVFKELTNLTSLYLAMFTLEGDRPLLTSEQLTELKEALPNTEIRN